MIIDFYACFPYYFFVLLIANDIVTVIKAAAVLLP